MQAHGIDLYIIPTDDFHASEYVGAHFRGRHYVSGFTGSAGTLVVTADWAGLWTDGRYFLQAGQQLEGSGIELCKMGEPGVPTIPEYIEKTLEAGQTLGFDGRVVTARQYEGYQRIAENPRLAKMIEDTEARYGAALSDDSLEFVSAAGETDIPQKKSKGGTEKR